MELSLPPELKRFVEKKVKEGLYEDESAVISEALRGLRERERWVARSTPGPSDNNWAVLGAMNGADIEAMAFIVMMQAAASAQEDLKSIMDHVKAINAAKQALREIMTSINRDVSANLGQERRETPLILANGMGSERAYHRVKVPVADPESVGGVKYIPTDLHPGRITEVAELRSIQVDLRDQLDSMSEMGEMESLRLPMALERRSKFLTTLSNLMKKSSETASAIVENLK